METNVWLIMFTTGIAIIFALHFSTHLGKDEKRVGGRFFLMVAGLLLIVMGIRDLEYQRFIKEKGGIPLKVSQLISGKSYRVINFLPEHNLLLVREGVTGFRTVIDPGKKLQGEEIFEVDDAGEIKVTKANK